MIAVVSPILVYIAIAAPIIVLIVVGLLYEKRKHLQPLVNYEFWVFSNVQRCPPIDAILHEAISNNPFNTPGFPCITTREGAFFTDIRFRCALATRKHNPEAFKPDALMELGDEMNDYLELLNSSHSLVRVQFASTIAIKSHAHLQFLFHVMAAMMRLTKSEIALDVVSQNLLTKSDVALMMGRSNNVEDFESQVRVHWTRNGDLGQARTRGMIKVGLPELETERLVSNMETTTTNLLRQAGKELFDELKFKTTLDLSYFGAQYKAEIQRIGRANALCRLLRLDDTQALKDLIQ